MNVSVRSVVVMALAGVVLASALWLQGGLVRDVKRGDTTREMQPIGLAARIPRQAGDWVGSDEPLGPTEFIQSAVERNLNYDDMVNRRYQARGRSLGVYVAYWSPQRMPVQKVASHTPDRCWSETGWRCEEHARWRDLRAGDQMLRPAYWRTFLPPGGGGTMHVLYWHLVGGELYDYGEGFNQMLNPLAWWRETLHYAFMGSADQYFIRLTSERPFEEIWDDPGVQEILAALAELGLAADAGRES
jgi:hypothetical protein